MMFWRRMMGVKNELSHAASAAKMRAALTFCRDMTKESQDCADGTKVHNEDGTGDAMCEEGVCYETKWNEIIKRANSALA